MCVKKQLKKCLEWHSAWWKDQGGGIDETYQAEVDYQWNWEWVTLLGQTLESPLDNKEIKPVNPKRNQLWIFIGRTDAEAEVPKIWPHDVKRQLIGKDPDDGKDWRQKEKRGNRGWDGWMASLTDWTWVWANSRRRWRTGKTGVLQSMGLQRVG